MQEFEIGEVLYKGEVAETWTGIHTSSKTEVFVIITNKKKLGHLVDHERIAKLAPIVKDVDSPFILKYHRMVQNENQLGIIMEHPRGQLLRDYLISKPERKLPEGEARYLFQQLVYGVEHLHSMQIVHRNLNLRNIWLTDSKQIKIGDFLVCAKVLPSKPTATFSNAHFYAPEMWQDNGGLATFASDIWTLGVLLYVMVCGVYPFDGKHEFEIFLSVKQAKIIIPPSISAECANLLKILLQVNFEQRPSIQAIKQHPWFHGPEVLSDGGSASSSPALTRKPHSNYLDSIPDESSSLPGSPLPGKFQNLTLSSSESETSVFSIDEHTSIVDVGENMGFNDFSPQTSYSTVPSPVFPANGDVQGFIQGMLRRVPSSGGTSFVPAFTPEHNNSSELSTNQNTSAFAPYSMNNASQIPTNSPPVVTRARRTSDSILQSQEVQKLLGITTDTEEDRRKKETKVKVESSPGTTRKAGRRLRRRSFDSQTNSPYNRIELPPNFASNTTENQVPPPVTAPSPQYTIPPYNHGVRIYSAPVPLSNTIQYMPPYFGVQTMPQQMPLTRNPTPPSKSPSPTPKPELTNDQLRFIMQQQMNKVQQVQLLAQQAALNSAIQSQMMNHINPSPTYTPPAPPQTPQTPQPQPLTPQDVDESSLEFNQDPFSNTALEPIDPTMLQQFEDTSSKTFDDLNLDGDLSAADLGAFISLNSQDEVLNSFFN